MKIICRALMFIGMSAFCFGDLVPDRPGDRGHSAKVEVRLSKLSLSYIHPPVVLKQRLPEYPDEMRLSGVAAEVKVRFVVDKNGDVTKREVVSSTWKAAGEAVAAVLQDWRFGPALDWSDRPVPVTADFVFAFWLLDDSYETEPNKAPEPTPGSVTPRADVPKSK